MKKLSPIARRLVFAVMILCVTGCADRKLMREAIEAASSRAEEQAQQRAALVLEYPGYRDLLVAMLFDEETVYHNDTQCEIDERNVQHTDRGVFGGGVRFLENSTIRMPALDVPQSGAISFWFRVAVGTDLSREIRLIDCNGICMMILQRRLRTVFHDSESMRRIVSPDPVRAARWLHAAFTWGGGSKSCISTGNWSGSSRTAGSRSMMCAM